MSILSMALYTGKIGARFQLEWPTNSIVIGYVLPDSSMIWVLRWFTYINVSFVLITLDAKMKLTAY